MPSSRQSMPSSNWASEPGGRPVSSPASIAAVKAVTSGEDVPAFNPWVALLGTQYEQGALIPDGRGPGPMDRLAPEGRPGIRAPHVWVRRGDERISTIDLAGPGFALLTGADGGEWVRAAEKLDIAGYRIGPGAEIDDPEGRWLTEVGIKPDGALLVRPDGIMAWRSVETVADPAGTLTEALRTILDNPFPNFSLSNFSITKNSGMD